MIWVKPVQAATSLVDMLTQGRFSGQLRLFYIDRNFNAKAIHRNGTAIGGYLRYETDSWHGVSLGAALYTTNRIFHGLEYDFVDPSLFGTNFSSYVFPGEAYLKYQTDNTSIKLGRQPLHTPLICGDDARMIACLYEAFRLKNLSFEHTESTLAHITGIAPGTIANTYAGGVLGVTAGYSYVGAQANNQFHNMGRYAIGQATPGVTVIGGKYSGFENLKLQAWNYIAWDFMNALYLQADIKQKTSLPFNPELIISAQYILQQEIGDNTSLPGINSHYWGIQIAAITDVARLYAAYSQTGKDPNAAINGGIITPWGGMPAFTQGMVTRHMFMAGTDAWKLQGSYLWKQIGINVISTAYVAVYDMDPLNGYSPGEKWTTTEAGFDVDYRPGWQKNLSLRFRANFTNDYFKNATSAFGWDEFRFIINYDF